jgi:hypothetical protein
MASETGSRQPSPRRTGPLDQQALETVRAVFRDMGVRNFIALWSMAFAVFAAHDSPQFAQFLTRCAIVVISFTVAGFLFSRCGSCLHWHSLGEGMVCIGAVYYLITVSHYDFLFAVTCALGIAVVCHLVK